MQDRLMVFADFPILLKLKAFSSIARKNRKKTKKQKRGLQRLRWEWKDFSQDLLRALLIFHIKKDSYFIWDKASGLLLQETSVIPNHLIAIYHRESLFQTTQSLISTNLLLIVFHSNRGLVSILQITFQKKTKQTELSQARWY